MMKLMEGKVALVTGAGMGLGEACALALAEQGATIMVADINDSAGQETVDAIVREGGSASFVHCDVVDGEQVKAMVDATIETFGRLDCAVNNAGIVGTDGAASVVDETEESFDKVIAIDLKGVFLCCKYEMAYMQTQGSGSIVNMSSVMGLNGINGSVAYPAAKHGVIGITKSVALSGAANGIRVNAVCPGIMRTPLVDNLVSQSGGAFENYAIATTPMARSSPGSHMALL